MATRAADVAAIPPADLDLLRDAALERTVSRSVEAVREFLGMDVAYATEMTDSEQRMLVLRGDGASFGVGEGSVLPREQTYCDRVLEGRLPNLIPDVEADDRAASLPITEQASVGAFVSVPLRRSDGSLYGTLCAADHEAQPHLAYRELQFLHVFARMIADQIEREELQERAMVSERQLAASTALMRAVEARDSYTADHSHEVVELAIAVAERLGIDSSELDDAARMALLHDIGKISIPDAILRKPGPLSAKEWEMMRRHPVHGEEMVSRTPSLEHLAPAIRAEHERWDGGGYPDGLRGETIPLLSRMVLACDAYNAMVSDRPYRAAMDRAAALQELRRGSGSQFDPKVVEALLGVLGAEHR